jgi:glutamate racemase
VTWSGGEHAAASALVDDHASIGILATEATIKSGAYEREILKRRPDLLVIGQACSDLSPMIEAGAKTDALRPVVKTYLADLYAKQKEGTPPISVVLLGCTHYELIADLISQELPKGVKLLGQSAIVAQALLDYLARHPEIDERLTKGGSRTFLTTGDAAEVSRLGSTFFGQGIQFETVHL